MSLTTDTLANLIDAARARQDSEDSVVLDGEDARRSIGLDGGPLTAAQVAEWMARHVECLREYNAIVEDQAARLRDLERQRDAVRAFLGTGAQA